MGSLKKRRKSKINKHKRRKQLRANRHKKLSIVPVGKKGRDSLKRAGFAFTAEYINVLAKVEFATAREIAGLAAELYAKGEIDSVYLIFSEFKTVITANLKVEKLLPVEPESTAAETSAETPASARIHCRWPIRDPSW
jgi:F-type H+-transporting ATPase subunit gamma